MKEIWFDRELEAKSMEMVGTNCETFNGGIFIELVETEKDEWVESRFKSDAVVFVQKEAGEMDQEEEVIDYYMKHKYEARKMEFNTEVQKYRFARFDEEGKEYGTFSEVPPSWLERKRRKKELEATQEEERKKEVFEFVFDEEASKPGHNTPNTESGGGESPR